VLPEAEGAPARGLDRLMQAARFRKKQLGEQATGAAYALALVRRQLPLTPAHRLCAASAGADHNSSGPAARVPWRSRLSATGPLHADTPQRQTFQLRLTLAAKARDTARARDLLAEMAASSCSPGPREYHAAAAAHALAGDVGGALRVMQDQHSRGGRALFETCVLPHARVSARVLRAPPELTGCLAARRRRYKAIIRASAGAGLPDLAGEAQEGATRCHIAQPRAKRSHSRRDSR
jgi:hypothetical protein